jgi:small-conductance mechanosensitive channel
MANGKRLGWILAVAASFSPFVARQIINWRVNYGDTAWVLTGRDTIGFLFDAALVALLLHSMTQQYVKRWLR